MLETEEVRGKWASGRLPFRLSGNLLSTTGSVVGNSVSQRGTARATRSATPLTTEKIRGRAFGAAEGRWEDDAEGYPADDGKGN